MDAQADAIVADGWDNYIGDVDHRLANYAEFLVEFLKKKNSRHIYMDAACGTGIDSIMLLENGFKVTSVDSSDNMVKLTLKKRWKRREERAFNEWVIQKADWLTLPQKLAKPDKGFDAIICIGNSITYLLDMGDIQLAIQNFHYMLKPGGWLIIDHRNYGAILVSGCWPKTNIYFNGKIFNDNTVENTSKLIIRDVCVGVSSDKETDLSNYTKENGTSHKKKFRFINFPLQLKDFTRDLKEVFGKGSKYEVYGDYKPLESFENPAFFIHFIQKNEL
ncbi:hypothetical protein JTE90_024607 [Oedothorax gibbosus]|uniref:Glycine N-methyltransferase n=1 Tax=Oedothorax gibbosus TaxID=931172 RepID=A0AAV6U1U2_9ARAC|nr:hypothetical protein JTE90_024607 [Oedothorax gibbosus]